MVPSVTNSPKNFNSQSNSIVAVKFLSSATDGTNFVANFHTATGVNHAAGPSYVVDYKDKLGDPDWTPLATNAGDGNPKAMTNALSSAPTRLFRLRVR